MCNKFSWVLEFLPRQRRGYLFGSCDRSQLNFYPGVETPTLSKKVLEFATLGTPEQARPARPRFGLDFQIHKVEDT